jgi:hypothetical protein
MIDLRMEREVRDRDPKHLLVSWRKICALIISEYISGKLHGEYQGKAFKWFPLEDA